MNKVIIGVGSNIDPEKNVIEAEHILTNEHTFLGKAQFIKTKPEGFKDQDDFLNGAFYVQTELGYDDFNTYLKEVEIRLKRIKGPIKSGPRTIDLDIVCFNEKIVDQDYFIKDYVRLPVNELIKNHNLDFTN